MTVVTKSTPVSTTLTKSLLLIEQLADAGRPMGLSELVREVGLPKSTVHRLLAILVNERLVQYEEKSRTYRTGFRFMSLAFRTWQNLDLRRLAIDEMRRLSSLTGENIHLAVPDANEIVYIDRVESHKILRLHSAIGNRASVHCTALGKSMVAFMPPERRRAIIASLTFERVAEKTITSARVFERELSEVRRRGYAVAIQEHQSDVCGVAASFRDFRGEIVGALSVSAPVVRTDEKRLHSWGPELMIAADKISTDLGWIH